MTGEQFLAMRVAYFFQEKDAEVEQVGIVVPDAVFAKAQADGKYEPLHLKASREVVATHLKARKQECNAGFFRMAELGDWNAFEHAADEYFGGAITAASEGKSYDRKR